MFDCEILEHIVTFAGGGSNTKELNLVSWNGQPAKYDLRIWRNTAEGRRASKGITLTGQELKALAEAINGLDLEGSNE